MVHDPVILGLDFGGTKIAVAVGGLAGNRLGSVTVRSGSELGARASFDRGIQAARDLLRTAAAGADLAAVGVSTFGIPFEDRVELAPAISGWGDLPLGRELHAAFPGAEIRMATDAKAAAQAEVRWGALAGCDPAVYLNLGTGLSAALVVGGQVITGGHGAAGEIGYHLRTVSDVGRTLDARVPLEDMVSGQALARRAASLARPAGPAAPPPPSPPPPSLTPPPPPTRLPPQTQSPPPARAGHRCPPLTCSVPAPTTLNSITWSASSSPSLPSMWSTWPSPSTRCGSPWAAAWSAPGTGCGRAWSRRWPLVPRTRPNWFPPTSPQTLR